MSAGQQQERQELKQSADNEHCQQIKAEPFKTDNLNSNEKVGNAIALSHLNNVRGNPLSHEMDANAMLKVAADILDDEEHVGSKLLRTRKCEITDDVGKQLTTVITKEECAADDGEKQQQYGDDGDKVCAGGAEGKRSNSEHELPDKFIFLKNVGRHFAVVSSAL